MSSPLPTDPKMLQLFDGDGQLCCDESQLMDAFQLAPNSNSSLYVVTIVGEMRTGKSRLCNELYFKGKEVFPTSKKATACTRGIHAARSGSIVVVDTEGLLSPEGKGKGFILFSRVISLSDVIIYNVEGKFNKEDAMQIYSASQLYSSAFPKSFNQKDLMGPVLIIYVPRPSPFLEKQTLENIMELFPNQQLPTSKNGGTFEDMILLFGGEGSSVDTLRDTIVRVITKKSRYFELSGYSRNETNLFQLIDIAYKTFHNVKPEEIPVDMLFRCMFPCPYKCVLCKKGCMGTRVQAHIHNNTNQCTQRHMHFKQLCEKCYRENKIAAVKKTNLHWSMWLSLGLKYFISGSDFVCDQCDVVATERHMIFWKNPKQDQIGRERCPNCLISREESYTAKDVPCLSHVWQAVPPSALFVPSQVGQKDGSTLMSKI